jgi:serine protease AprX
VIEGIDWVIDHKSQFNIRVINLSLGHPVNEPSATDPLCEAVERAFDAGIVVVAAAGNYGRTADGHRVLGGITSPGNSPYAITVGAVDTKGTVSRSDDEVAAYSSRGPTEFDFAVKPDIVAPGTHVVSLEASNSYLSTSGYETHIWGSGQNAYGRLTGTSMAAAVVSGGVALLLEANPSLDPTRVKVALQAGASFIRDGGLIGAGAGSVNFKLSRQIATGGLVVNLQTISIGGVTVSASGATFRDNGTLIDRLYDGTGLKLVDPILATLLWSSPSFVQSGKLYLLGLTNPLALLTPKQMVWGEAGYWTSSEYIVWGNSMQDSDGDYIVWGNSEGDGDYIVWGNNVRRGGAR